MILCFVPTFVWSNNLLLFNLNNNRYPNLETYTAYFTQNFEPVELIIGNSILRINNKTAKIDSSVLINSSSKKGINLTIAIELSSAINANDIAFFKNIYSFFSTVDKSVVSNIHFTFFSEKPILFNDFEDNTQLFDLLLSFNFVRKPDLNRLINSKTYKDLQARNNNALLLITKSSVKVNTEFFVNYINSTQTKLLHINLSSFQYPVYENIAMRTNSISLDISEFMETDKLMKLSTYLLTSGPYYKLYSTEQLVLGSNKIELKTDLAEDSKLLDLTENDFPKLEIPEPAYFFGIIDSGIKRTKLLRIQANNRPLVITKITSNNPNFTITNFQSNTKLLPKENFDLGIEFRSKSTVFDSSIITIQTNFGKEYLIFAYAGKPKTLSNTYLKFINLEQNEIFLGGNPIQLQWIGSHPLDTVLLQYKLEGENSWKIISNRAANNFFNWVIPDIPDTSILFRISQINSKLISDKVILLEEHRGKITEVSFSPNDSLIATAGEDGFIYLWNTKTGIKQKTLFQSQTKTISGISWSKDGKYLAIAALDTSIKIWSIETDVLYKDVIVNSKVVNAVFSYDGNYLIARSIDNRVMIWEFPSLTFVNSIQVAFPITYFEINPNYHYFLATNIDGSFIVFDYIKQENVKVFPLTGFPILTGSFSPSGNNVAIAGVDNKIRIYDIHTGQNVLTLFDTRGPIIAVNWLKNRLYIASSNGELIKLWSPSDGKLLETYDQHSSAVYYIKSNNKGNLVASIDQNNIIHLWSPFDFPFIRPLAISVESTPIKLIQKKVQTNNYTISNLQISDTLAIYFEDIAINKTNTTIIIDTLTFLTTSNIIDIDEKYSNYPFATNKSIPICLNYIPRNIGANQVIFNIKSGAKIFSSQINANVLPNILDKKFMEIDLGSVEIGKSKDTSVFILQNISEAPIRIDSIKFFNGDDFKLVSLQLPFSIQPTGGVFAPTIRFSPMQIGSKGGFFRIYLNRLLPIDVYFYGNGIAPKLEIENVPELISNICDKLIKIPITLANSGNAKLEIKEIQINGANIEEFLINTKTSTLEPQITDTIWIEWRPNSIGLSNHTVTIITNLQSNGSDRTTFNIRTKNDFYSFLITPNPLVFEPINDSDKVQKILTIHNKGSKISSIQIIENLKYFQVDSIKQNFDLFVIFVRFSGGLKKEFYSDTLLIRNDCGYIYKVELMALLQQDKAIMTIPDLVDLGTLICEDKIEKQIPVQNIGNSELIISNITFKKLSNNLDVSPNALILSPNSFSYITIKFQSNKKEIIENKIILQTNAINFEQGTATINLKGTKESIDYIFDSDTIDFGKVYQNDELEKYANFTNLSSIPLFNSFQNSSSLFILSYTKQQYISPNEQQKIKITYRPNTNTGKVLDSIVYKDICGNSKKVILTANILETPRKLEFSLPYPNPTFDLFTIEIKSNFNYELNYQLYDYLGKIIKEQDLGTIYNNEYKLEFNLNNYSAGVYLLRLLIHQKEYQFKIIKLN